MYQFSYDLAKLEMSRRQEGLRQAQRDGTAYEYRPRKRFSLPWRRAGETPGARPGNTRHGRAEPGLS